MSKQSNIETEGVVTEALGNSNFRVQIMGDTVLMCTISGKMRMNYIKIIPGDKVKVEMSPYDLTRGRIVKRLR